MSGERRGWMLLGTALGVVFVLLSLVDLVFVDGDGARDLVGMGLGGLLAAVAFARYRGWRGLPR